MIQYLSMEIEIEIEMNKNILFMTLVYNLIRNVKVQRVLCCTPDAINDIQNEHRVDYVENHLHQHLEHHCLSMIFSAI